MGQTTDLWWGGCKAIAIKTSSSRALGRSGKCSSAVLLFGHSAVLQVFSCVFAHMIDIMFFGLASRSSLSLCLTLSWTLLCTERNFWVGHYYAHIRAVNVWVWLRPFSSKLFANMVENSKPSISFPVSCGFVHLHDGQLLLGQLVQVQPKAPAIPKRRLHPSDYHPERSLNKDCYLTCASNRLLLRLVL